MGIKSWLQYNMAILSVGIDLSHEKYRKRRIEIACKYEWK